MWRKNYKNKTANEWTWNIYSCKNNSQIWIVQPEFATWKYKAKLSAEAASGGVFIKAVRKNFAIFTGNTCVEVVRFKNIRSSHQRGSMKKCVLRNFTKFAGKHLCQSIFFNKKLGTLLKKRLWHRCFPVNFAKFLRTSFIKEHLWWLLLKILTISAVQVFSPEPFSTVVSFSRIISIH